MLGGGKLPHPTSRCVQSSLCEPNPVLRGTAAAVRAPLRRRPRYIIYIFIFIYLFFFFYLFILFILFLFFNIHIYIYTQYNMKYMCIYIY